MGATFLCGARCQLGPSSSVDLLFRYWLYAALWLSLPDDDETPLAEEAAVAAAAAAAAEAPTAGAEAAGTADKAPTEAGLCPTAPEWRPAAAPPPPPTAHAAAAVTRGGQQRLPVFVVTNDEMRDHHFRMPSAAVAVRDVQAFVRWKERHVCTFDVWGQGRQRRRVQLFLPTPFSVRMQGATAAGAAPLPSDRVACWHVPTRAGEPPRSFEGHEYGHASGYAGSSKPVDPAHFEWLVVARESLLEKGGAPPP